MDRGVIRVSSLEKEEIAGFEKCMFVTKIWMMKIVCQMKFFFSKFVYFLMRFFFLQCMSWQVWLKIRRQQMRCVDWPNLGGNVWRVLLQNLTQQHKRALPPGFGGCWRRKWLIKQQRRYLLDFIVELIWGLYIYIFFFHFFFIVVHFRNLRSWQQRRVCREGWWKRESECVRRKKEWVNIFVLEGRRVKC